jgi:hypothetical protein
MLLKVPSGPSDMSERQSNRPPIPEPQYTPHEGGIGAPGIQPIPNLNERAKPPPGPRQLTAVSNFLTEKGLFTAYTPKGEDPTWYPLDVLHELQGDLDRKAQQAGQDTARAEKFASWKKSVQNLQMAYEIIAFPHFDEMTRGYAVMELAWDSMQKGPNNAPGELNDEERSMLGRLTLARGLPFDPGKQTYRYSELYALCEAEHIVYRLEKSVAK